MTKEARKEYDKEWYVANREKALAQQKEYYAANQEKALAQRKEYQAANKDKIRAQKKEWYAANKDKVNKYRKNRRDTNLNYRIACNLRNRLYQALNGNFKTGSGVRDLGCTIEELKLKFIPLFTQGMSWDNYGTEWHIDHIRPCASFDLSDPAQAKQCCHFSNLQPLWVADNLAKSDKY